MTRRNFGAVLSATAAAAEKPKQGVMPHGTIAGVKMSRNGADFIAVGMFDYQVRENAEIARTVLARHKNRTSRPWRA